MGIRQRFLLMGVLLVAPLLLAMGGGGGGPSSDTIPRPEENHPARVVDRQGVTTEVEHTSCNGRTFFPLERGEGVLMVPFAKIARATFGAENGTRVAAHLVTPDGTSLDGTIPRTLLCTGVTTFGNFRIEARGIAEVVFENP